MLISRNSLNSLSSGFKTAFREALDNNQLTADYQKITTKVQSQSASEEYGWLNVFPTVREWVGDRIINQMTLSGYTLENQHFEQTISVDRNDIEDDRYGVYGSIFKMMGEEVARFPNKHIFQLLKNGWKNSCFDNAYFFANNHKKINADGKIVNYANTDLGEDEPWFLLDASRTLKPLIYQVRKPFEFSQIDNSDDERVFLHRQYLYGVDGRAAFGYGLPFLAWGSKQKLNEDKFNNAVVNMMSTTGDYDTVLGLSPTHLVVPPKLREKALSIVKTANSENGATNINHNAVEVIVSPWLA